MHKIKFLLLVALFGRLTLSAQDHESRYKIIDITNYSFSIELNDSTDIIEGKAILSFSLLQKTDTLYLDLAGKKYSGKGMTIDEIRDGTGPVNYIHFADKIRIPSREFTLNTPVNIIIKYHGIPADGLIISKNKFGDRTFFGDNWPARAHQWLPCVDHPADKATVQFTVVAPSCYQCISNGTCSGETICNGILTSVWKSTEPLPTKLMVIGVARFAKQDLAIVSGIPVSTWVYPQNKKEGFDVYSCAIKPMVFFSRLIAPFPFSKLADVQSTTLYGGMENASCIFYSENLVTGNGSAEKTIAHEISHQWFGDAVSEKDWYHVWLSEGFATYLAGMYLENNYGKAAFQKYLNQCKKDVFDYERIKSAPVIDTSLSISDELLGPNTYQKASWVLHMLRRELGDSLFINCLRTFYQEYKYKNAVTNDFRNIAERLSGRNLEEFFDQWLYKTGHPVLDITWEWKSGSVILTVNQVQDNTIFKFPLELKLINKSSGSSIVRLDISNRSQTFTIESAENPSGIIADPGNSLLMEYSLTKKDDPSD